MCDILKMIGGVVLVVGTFLYACEQILVVAICLVVTIKNKIRKNECMDLVKDVNKYMERRGGRTNRYTPVQTYTPRSTPSTNQSYISESTYSPSDTHVVKSHGTSHSDHSSSYSDHSSSSCSYDSSSCDSSSCCSCD